MSDEPEFPSAHRSAKSPKRPAGLGNLTPRQEKRAQAAEKLYRVARREGWTRARFYFEVNRMRGVLPAIRDGLIRAYVEPRHSRLRKRVPPGWTPRTLQENMIETINYLQDLEADGARYVIIQQEGGYRVYVQPRSP